MNSATSLELKCECAIPFHADLISYLTKLFSNGSSMPEPDSGVPHQQEIAEALEGKTIFVSVDFAHPVTTVRPATLKRIKNIFKKDIVGVMKIGAKEITYVLI